MVSCWRIVLKTKFKNKIDPIWITSHEEKLCSFDYSEVPYLA